MRGISVISLLTEGVQGLLSSFFIAECAISLERDLPRVKSLVSVKKKIKPTHTRRSFTVTWCKFLVEAGCSDGPSILRWRGGLLLWLLPYFFQVGSQGRFVKVKLCVAKSWCCA